MCTHVPHTLEIGRKYGLEICWLYRPVCLSTKKLLFESTSSLTKVEQEQLHQPRFSIGTENLLEAIDSKGTLIFKPWSWLTAMALANGFICLVQDW